MLSNRDMLELIGNMKVFLKQSGGSERGMNVMRHEHEHNMVILFEDCMPKP